MANPGDEHAAGNIPLEMPPERTELERTWTAILQEIAKLSDAMGLDSGDWAEADDCTLGQEFDPWVVLREATKRASAWEADIGRIEALEKDKAFLLEDNRSLHAQLLVANKTPDEQWAALAAGEKKP